MTQITNVRLEKQPELYTLEYVVKSAEHLDIQPPLCKEEALAVYGLLNHSRIDHDDRANSELRFDIMKASYDEQMGKIPDARMIQLHGLLKVIESH